MHTSRLDRSPDILSHLRPRIALQIRYSARFEDLAQDSRSALCLR